MVEFFESFLVTLLTSLIVPAVLHFTKQSGRASGQLIDGWVRLTNGWVASWLICGCGVALMTFFGWILALGVRNRFPDGEPLWKEIVFTLPVFLVCLVFIVMGLAVVLFAALADMGYSAKGIRYSFIARGLEVPWTEVQRIESHRLWGPVVFCTNGKRLFASQYWSGFSDFIRFARAHGVKVRLDEDHDPDA
jgi:hypothetical protein